VDIGDILWHLRVSGIEQRTAGEHGIGLRHLAAEKLNGEAHGYAG
jgi:hypothetical protein